VYRCCIEGSAVGITGTTMSSHTHSLSSVEEILGGYYTDLSTGLLADNVDSLRQLHGVNKLESDAKEHICIQYIEQFKDPLILMLLGSAVLSVIVGQYEDALSIAAAVIIVGSVAFYQEYKSEQSLEALNTLVPPRCNVVRARQRINILAEELVPGDIITLISGDRVPADARILVCSGLSVDESSLTGESEPREKTSNALELNEDAQVSDKKNLVFMGTLVCSGHATCIVTETGLATEFGKTFQEMKDIENRRTPLQVKMDELGKRLSIFSFGIIACIGVLGMIQGKSFLAMFNIGVSLAVAAIPEGLPICVTVTLALGVMRMARKNAIVKKLPSVEALGCADYICSDKTGTLTMNRMTVTRAYCPAMDDAVLIDDVTSSAAKSHSYSSVPKASLSASLSFNSLTHSTPSSYNGQVDLQVTYNGQSLDIQKHPCLLQLFDAACLCNNAHIQSDGKGVGQPTEAALLLAGMKLGIPDRRVAVKRINEIKMEEARKEKEK